MAKTLFSPPRNKPKLSLAQPTLAIGQPFTPPQSIPEPIHFIGAQSGTHYGTAGDNPNGQEQVSITPPPGPTSDPAGGPSYASGGSFLVGGDQSTRMPKEVMPEGGGGGGSSNPYPQTMGTGIFSGNWQPPQQQVRPIISSPYGDPNQALYTAQQGQMQARNSALDLRARALDIRSQNQPLQNAVYSAKSNVIGAQTQQNQMQKGYLQQVGKNDQQRLQELQGIYGASQNAPDLLNTASAQTAYSSENRRDAQMGVAPPTEVNLPPGYNGPKVAGVRPKIMSQEQRLAEKAGYEDPIRNQQLSIAKNIVDLQGTDVQAAQLAASRAGLSLEQANDLVSRAQLEADYAGIISSRRDIEAQQAGTAPQPGFVRYTDPATGMGEWVTPQEHDELSYQYSQARGAERYEATPLGAFSRAFVENLLRYHQISDEAAIAGLMAGGRGRPPMSRQQAQLVVANAHNQGGGSLAPLDAAGNPTQQAPTNATPPASAPTGTITATGPTLPPGYIP